MFGNKTTFAVKLNLNLNPTMIYSLAWSPESKTVFIDFSLSPQSGKCQLPTTREVGEMEMSQRPVKRGLEVASFFNLST